MKIPVWILSAVFAALLALQGWTLDQVSNLRSDVAVLQARFDDHFKSAGVIAIPGEARSISQPAVPSPTHGAQLLTQK